MGKKRVVKRIGERRLTPPKFCLKSLLLASKLTSFLAKSHFFKSIVVGWEGGALTEDSVLENAPSLTSGFWSSFKTNWITNHFYKALALEKHMDHHTIRCLSFNIIDVITIFTWRIQEETNEGSQQAAGSLWLKPALGFYLSDACAFPPPLCPGHHSRGARNTSRKLRST